MPARHWLKYSNGWKGVTHPSPGQSSGSQSHWCDSQAAGATSAS